MNHASVVLVRCPSTGRELSAGVEMDTATFERLSDIHSLISVPFAVWPFATSIAERRGEHAHPLTLRSVTACELPLPSQRMPDYRIEIVQLGTPIKCFSNACDISN